MVRFFDDVAILGVIHGPGTCFNCFYKVGPMITNLFTLSLKDLFLLHF